MVLAETSITLLNVELVNPQVTAQPALDPSLYIVLNSRAHLWLSIAQETNHFASQKRVRF